jgi:hypothetical protein
LEISLSLFFHHAGAGDEFHFRATRQHRALNARYLRPCMAAFRPCRLVPPAARPNVTGAGKTAAPMNFQACSSQPARDP